MTEYPAAVLRHFREPVGAGVFAPDQLRFGTAALGTVKSGTKVVFQLGLSADGLVDRVGWLAFGCPSTVACCSWFADMLPGHDVSQAKELLHGQVADALSIPRDVRTRVLVVEDAGMMALRLADEDRQKTR